MTAKCPKCEKIITAFDVENLDIRARSTAWAGIAQSCPYCKSAIRVTIDLVPVKTDMSAASPGDVDSSER